MAKQTAWSFSRLKSYETCPKKFWHTSVQKDFVEVQSDAGNYGTEVHKAIQQRLANDKKLPLHMTHLEPIIARFAEAPGTKYVEQQLALNGDVEPTGWFDNDVWCRAIIDLAIVNGDHALLCDWKTGKMDDDFTQQRVAAAVFAVYFPEVKTFDLVYYWLKDKKPTKQSVERSDLPAIWNKILPRIRKYMVAHSTTDFPPRPSGLCKRYCPVTTCPHYGGE